MKRQHFSEDPEQISHLCVRCSGMTWKDTAQKLQLSATQRYIRKNLPLRQVQIFRWRVRRSSEHMAANELLDISEIKASFVLTEYNGKIYVSARSIDEVNVQVIMEKLGGGGHMNASGAQFNHTDMDEAVACLKQVLDNMIKEGDI